MGVGLVIVKLEMVSPFVGDEGEILIIRNLYKFESLAVRGINKLFDNVFEVVENMLDVTGKVPLLSDNSALKVETVVPKPAVSNVIV